MHALPARHLVSTTCTVDNVTNAMYCNMLPDVFTLFSGQPGMILSFSFCFSFSFSFLFLFFFFSSSFHPALYCRRGTDDRRDDRAHHGGHCCQGVRCLVPDACPGAAARQPQGPGRQARQGARHHGRLVRKEKEKTTPCGVSLMKTQVLHRAAQGRLVTSWYLMVTAVITDSVPVNSCVVVSVFVLWKLRLQMC